MKLPNAEAAFIDLAKLQNYSLNSQHDRGQHKARLFAAILGLGSDDTKILRAIILEAIQTYDAVSTRVDEYGGSPGIVVETVGQASSLRGQDARPTANFVFLITSNPGEPIWSTICS